MEEEELWALVLAAVAGMAEVIFSEFVVPAVVLVAELLLEVEAILAQLLAV